MCSLTHDKRKKVGQTIFIRQKGAKNGRIEQTFILFFNKKRCRTDRGLYKVRVWFCTIQSLIAC